MSATTAVPVHRAPALLLGALLLMAAAHTPSHAFDPITWTTVDGGGSRGSETGSYRLAGTIGQPDAGRMTGGGFTVRGGFWAGGAGATLDAPEAAGLPRVFRVLAPAPNPVRSSTRLAVELPAAVECRLQVFDLSGRRVQQQALGRLAAGRHAVAWSAADDGGRALPAGIYLLRFDAGVSRAHKRILVVR